MERFLDFEEKFLSLVTGKHEWLASHFTELFHSVWPYGIVLALSLLTLLTFYDTNQRLRRNLLGSLLIRIIFVAFPAAMLLMQVALLTLGRSESVWWCDPSRQGGWNALFRIGLFALFLLVQWVAATFYFTCLKLKADEDNDQKYDSIEFSSLIISLLAFHPIGSWLIYHFGSWIHLPAIVGIVLWVAIPIVGLVFTWMVNTGTFGFKRGLPFTLISFCVAAGLLAGLCCLAEACGVLYDYISFWSYAPLIILVPIILVLMAYREKDGGKQSDGTNIILYWWENPGWLGVVLAVVLGYLAGHFWFKWF